MNVPVAFVKDARCYLCMWTAQVSVTCLTEHTLLVICRGCPWISSWQTIACRRWLAMTSLRLWRLPPLSRKYQSLWCHLKMTATASKGTFSSLLMDPHRAHLLCLNLIGSCILISPPEINPLLVNVGSYFYEYRHVCPLLILFCCLSCSCFAEGAEDFLIKPVQMEDVRRLQGHIRPATAPNECSNSSICGKRKSTDGLQSSSPVRKARYSGVAVA